MNQRATLIERLGQLAPIASLPLERREEIAQLCTLENLLPEDGSFDVLVGGDESALHPVRPALRTVQSCKPITAVELLRLDERTLDMSLAWDQSSTRGDVSSKLAGTDWRMMSGMFAVQNLTRSAFASLPAANIARLLERFRRVEVRRGDVVIREGDPGDSYYLIESGRGYVTREVGGVDLEIADLKPGDAFGEEALLANASRNATVAMKTDGVLLRLSKGDFVELLKEPLLHRVNWQEARRRVASGAQWIDVRYPAEFVHDGLPNAINIPLNEIRRAAPLLDAGREYVAYCQSGRRSAAAAFLLSQRGLRASVLADGLCGHHSTMPETVSP